ncbi:MAG: toll/interleukin-1 receptor domain-containing protein [Flavitalea sp.]
MESKPEIFFSYAWGDATESGSSREKIVNELYEALIADGFTVIRDKNDLRYKGLISDLTGRIGRGKFIVVAISDKYLKSTYCMSELLEIYRRSNSDIDEMLKKIFPIVLEDAKIYNPEDRVDYLKYWEDKKEELNEELKGISLEHAATFADDLRVYNEITSVIPVLSKLLKDINTLNLQKLSANNFSEIKNAISNAALSASASTEAEKIKVPVAGKRLLNFSYWRTVIATLIVIAMIAVFLHLGHVSNTDIRIELSVSEVNFTISEPQVVTSIMKLSSLGASGLKNVEVPTRRTVAQSGPGDPASAVLLSVDTNNQRPGTITLDALPLPTGVRIGLRHMDEGEYRFSLEGKVINLPVQVNGFVSMVLPPNPLEVLHFTSPGLIKLQSGEERVDIDCNFLSQSNRIFPGTIAADSISLSRVDENFDTENSIIRTVSTIMSGTLYFESLGNQKQLMLQGQQIRFDKSQGKITTLELSKDHIAITFMGRVSGMTTGDSKDRTSLMPTYLEWLRARVNLTWLLAAVFIIPGLLFVIRRFRRTSI